MARHKELRKLMFTYDIKQTDFEEVLGRKYGYISSRMTGASPWDIDDIYKICDFFNAMEPENPPMPYESIPLYFPRGGIGKPAERRAAQKKGDLIRIG